MTGAGIGALITVPGQDPAQSNVNLAAPHGTVDAGAAGIRVAGNFNVVALQILNAFNIQVQGTTLGLPTVSGPNVGALTTAGNTAAAAQATAPVPASSNSNQASVIIVEVLGYGGGNDDDQRPGSQDNGRQREDKRSYNMNSVLQLVGNGPLSDAQKESLTDEEKKISPTDDCVYRKLRPS